MSANGERQRNGDRGLRQQRKELLEGDVAQLLAAEPQLAHRQPVAGGENVIGKDQQQLLNAVELLRLRVQAHQPLLRVQALFYP